MDHLSMNLFQTTFGNLWVGINHPTTIKMNSVTLDAFNLLRNRRVSGQPRRCNGADLVVDDSLPNGTMVFINDAHPDNENLNARIDSILS